MFTKILALCLQKVYFCSTNKNNNIMKANSIFNENKNYNVMGTIIEATSKKAAVTKFIYLTETSLSERQIERKTKLVI